MVREQKLTVRRELTEKRITVGEIRVFNVETRRGYFEKGPF